MRHHSFGLSFQYTSARSTGAIARSVTAILALVALSLVAASAAGAQGFSFAMSQTISSDLLGARSVRIADLDLDGDLDVVAASTSNNIVWIENLTGDLSSLTRHFISEFGGATWALDVGDIDNDGIPDVLATRTGSDAVQWFRRASLSSNTWAAVTVGSFADPAAAQLADMDSDGDLDVVVTSNSDNYIRWRKNVDGLGTVWSAVISLGVGGAAGFDIVDLDLDGDLDFVVAAQAQGQIVWWQNMNGLGTTWSATILTSGLVGAWSVDVGDIDHDGDLDIAASAQGAGEVAVLVNNGASPPVFAVTTLDDDFAGAREVRFVDIDLDGDLDVLGVAELRGELALWENWKGPSGVGTVQWRRWSISNLVAEAWDFDTGDLDGDGDLDLVVAGPFVSDPVLWFRNDTPHPRYEYGLGSVRELVSSFGTGFNATAFGDIDGDGAVDIVAGGSNHLGWWTGPTSATPGIRTEISTEIAQHNGDLEVVDLDRDGDLDIVASRAGNLIAKVLWWENLGAGTSWAQRYVGTNGGDEQLEVADLFGNGELVVILHGSEPNTSIRSYGPPFTELGGGVYTLVGQHGSKALGIGDMDGDGDLDLVSGGYGINEEASLIVIEQDVSGFTRFDLSDSRIDDLELIDWDQDGDLDIIAVNKTPGQILWFENIPGESWNFVEHDITPNVFGDPVDSYDEVVVGDFDLDGRNELWAANTIPFYPDGQPFVIKIERDPLQYVELAIETNPGMRLQATDIDQDGDDDLMILDRESNTISSLNISPEVFRIDGVHSTGHDPLLRGVEYQFAYLWFENLALETDGEIGLTSVSIRWESRPSGWPAEPAQILSQAEVSAIVGNIRVFFDDGDIGFDEDLDTLLVSTSDFTFVDGRMMLEFPAGLVVLDPMQSRLLFFRLTPKLHAPAIDRLGIVLDTLPAIEHLDTGSPIHRGFVGGFFLGFLLEIEPSSLFSDGFESGDTSAWSNN